MIIQTEPVPNKTWNNLISVEVPSLLLALSQGRTLISDEVAFYNAPLVNQVQVLFKTTPADSVITSAVGYQIRAQLHLSEKTLNEKHLGYYNFDRVSKIALLLQEQGFENVWIADLDGNPFVPGSNVAGYSLHINGELCSIAVSFGYKDFQTADDFTTHFQKSVPNIESAGPNKIISLKISGLDERPSEFGGIPFDGKSLVNTDDYSRQIVLMTNQVQEFARISGNVIGALCAESGQSTGLPHFAIGAISSPNTAKFN